MVTIPDEKIEALFNAIDFVVSPYLEEIEDGEEGIAQFKENYPWLYDLCQAHDAILKNCPGETWSDFEFYGL